MTYKIWTRYEPIMLKIIIKTFKPENMCLKVYDPTHANTNFTEREKIINGQEEMYVRMPLSPNTACVQIYNKTNGDLPSKADKTFVVIDVVKEELDITLPATNMDNSLVRSFVRFAQKFCYNAGWVAADKDYASSNGQFKIEYLPYIVSSKSREKMQTPARISTKNGRIQVSQESFVPFSIPMRMAILLHEFSHFYINTDISNETEADLNGLTIYLGLGYPIREGLLAFGETFVGYPTAENKKRYDIINTFIKNYISEHNIKDVYATGK